MSTPSTAESEHLLQLGILDPASLNHPDPRNHIDLVIRVSDTIHEKLNWLYNDPGILATRIIQAALIKAELRIADRHQGPQSHATSTPQYYSILQPPLPRIGLEGQDTWMQEKVPKLTQDDWAGIIKDYVTGNKAIGVLAELHGYGLSECDFINYLLSFASGEIKSQIQVQLTQFSEKINKLSISN